MLGCSDLAAPFHCGARAHGPGDLMRIVFAASEMSPLAQTGGLGDALEGLPARLADRGHDVSVFLPCYRGLREDAKLGVRSTGAEITVPIGDRRLTAKILECTGPNGVQVFLIRRDEYFDRAALYGNEGRAYEDNAERFIFFQGGRRAGAPHQSTAGDCACARLADGADPGADQGAAFRFAAC